METFSKGWPYACWAFRLFRLGWDGSAASSGAASSSPDLALDLALGLALALALGLAAGLAFGSAGVLLAEVRPARRIVLGKLQCRMRNQNLQWMTYKVSC